MASKVVVKIPSEFPMEEIAKEIAKIRLSAWEENKEHVKQLWASTVQKAYRPWIILLCLLTGTSAFFFLVLAYRVNDTLLSP